MSDDKKPPSALQDAAKGLGLLFRAAKTTIQKIPTDPIEKVVLDGAREVGRAVENVATTLEKTFEQTIEKTMFRKDKPSAEPPPAAGAEEPTGEVKASDAAPPAGSEKPEGGGDAGGPGERRPRVG